MLCRGLVDHYHIEESSPQMQRVKSHQVYPCFPTPFHPHLANPSPGFDTSSAEARPGELLYEDSYDLDNGI
jgi:hypothetical protein